LKTVSALQEANLKNLKAVEIGTTPRQNLDTNNWSWFVDTA